MENNTSSVSIDDKLKIAQIDRTKAEAEKILSESKHGKLNALAGNISEAIKVIAGIVIGLGGFVAAKTQFEIAELRAATASEKVSQAESAASAASAAANAAMRQKIDLEIAISDLKNTHAELTKKIQTADPKIAPSRLVYIQFNGSITREKINDLRSALGTKGFSAPGGERVAGNYQAQVKYFSESDEGIADKLANEVQSYLESAGCAPQKLRVIPSTAAKNKASPLEVWLPSDCK